MYALIDCNNFYVSCERIFRSDLINKPVVVLSNNDGCIIARSNEVKQLGVPMGAPLFQYRTLLEKYHTTIFSSNYQLYADISRRIMMLIKQYAPCMEVYSIDEAFIQFESRTDYFAFASHLKKIIKQWIGVPVSIGIAPTKTLAKAANYVAKNNTSNGIYICLSKQISLLLKQVPLSEIWGVGRNMLEQFKRAGITTSLNLQQRCSHQIQKKYGVVYQKLVMELKGQSFLPLENIQPKQKIMSSRSFSYEIIHFHELAEAIANFISTATKKARSQKSMATGLQVFVRTNRFNQKSPQYRNFIEMNFDTPTNDTGHLIHIAKQLLKQIYREGYRYKKAGVSLTGLIHESAVQHQLLPCIMPAPRKRLRQLLDNINQKQGRNAVYFASQGNHRTWMPNCNCRSPRYTTQWNELYLVDATY